MAADGKISYTRIVGEASLEKRFGEAFARAVSGCTELASLYELAHGVLGGLESSDQALANITADVASLAGVVR